MKVVHCKKEPYDVYIGRGSKWGNPYSHKEGTQAKFIVASRKEAIEKYREYILNSPELLNCLHELRGQTLGCWCKPKACHGDVLVELVEERFKVNSETERVMKMVRENLRYGKYIPLSKEDSQIARQFYADQIPIPLNGGDHVFTNESGTVIARGYNRVVIGDYGPFIEYTPEQIVTENIKQKWPGEPKSGIKYIWMETKDQEKTKIYFQHDTVPYADYKIGMYYVDPRIVFMEEEIR